MSRFTPLILLLPVVVTGCPAGPRDRDPKAQQAYFGPTQTLSEIVAEINQNNRAIWTLRAAGHFEANVVDRGRRQFVNGDITLLYRRPDEVRLIGRKDIAGVIFEAGSNSEQYWLIVRGDTDTMWHGRIENLDRVDPSDLPIRPDALIEVLGIDEIPADLLSPPVPTMRFNNDADAYMLTFNVRLPDRWAVRKELWYDRQTKLPRLVLLFNEHGRIVMRAYLSNHRAVEGADPAQLSTRYQIFFPDSGTTLRFDLDDVALTRGRPPAPNDRSFLFPTAPGVGRVIDLDEPAQR